MALPAHGAIQELAVTAVALVLPARAEELTTATLPGRSIRRALDVLERLAHVLLAPAEKLGVGANSARVRAALDHWARQCSER